MSFYTRKCNKQRHWFAANPCVLIALKLWLKFHEILVSNQLAFGSAEMQLLQQGLLYVNAFKITFRTDENNMTPRRLCKKWSIGFEVIFMCLAAAGVFKSLDSEAMYNFFKFEMFFEIDCQLKNRAFKNGQSLLNGGYDFILISIFQFCTKWNF